MTTLEMVKKTAKSGNNLNSGDFYLIVNIKTGRKIILWANTHPEVIAEVIDGKRNGFKCIKPIQNEETYEALLSELS